MYTNSLTQGCKTVLINFVIESFALVRLNSHTLFSFNYVLFNSMCRAVYILLQINKILLVALHTRISFRSQFESQ